MGKVKNGLIALFVICILGLVMLKNMMLDGFDFDSDGKISISKAWNSIDTGRRQTTIEGRSCIEYFNKKDGLTFKEVCDGDTQ